MTDFIFLNAKRRHVDSVAPAARFRPLGRPHYAPRRPTRRRSCAPAPHTPLGRASRCALIVAHHPIQRAHTALGQHVGWRCVCSVLARMPCPRRFTPIQMPPDRRRPRAHVSGHLLSEIIEIANPLSQHASVLLGQDVSHGAQERAKLGRTRTTLHVSTGLRRVEKPMPWIP